MMISMLMFSIVGAVVTKLSICPVESFRMNVDALLDSVVDKHTRRSVKRWFACSAFFVCLFVCLYCF